MSVVLPATIPGLVRRCSPEASSRVCIGNAAMPGYVLTRPTDFGGKAIPREDFGLDLLDPTGQHHALLWLAERVGLDASGGVCAEYLKDRLYGLVLRVTTADRREWNAGVRGVPGFPALADIDPDGEHALALAIQATVLHLAGVSA